MLGRKCSNCGYDRCLDAIQFHHKDPATKKFEISDSIFGKSGNYTEKEIIEEVNKCLLLCANCHFELHAVTSYGD